MKKYLLILIIIPVLFFLSCSEDFNINAPKENVYSLNCVLRNDTTIQYAVVSVNRYTENGTSPLSNSIEQNIKGAVIKIFYNDSVFVMRDTTVQVLDSGIGTEVNCYYVKNLVIQPGKVISIKAVVPDGHVLKSTIQVPKIRFKFLPGFPQLYDIGYVKLPNYSWDWTIGYEESKYILNFPQLDIYYKKYEEGTFVDRKRMIPISYNSYMDENGMLYSPDIRLSFSNFCMTTLKNVNKTMKEISEDDTYKNNYTINKVVFSVIGLSAELTKYYSAFNVYSNDFTIKLRSTDYSNIEGGRGIFGTYYKHLQSLRIDKMYINSFGYQYDPK